MVLFGEEGLVQDFQPEIPDGKLNTKIKTEWVEEDVYNETENNYPPYPGISLSIINSLDLF